MLLLLAVAAVLLAVVIPVAGHSSRGTGRPVAASAEPLAAGYIERVSAEEAEDTACMGKDAAEELPQVLEPAPAAEEPVLEPCGGES
jgi:hypothetical protein